MHHLTSWSSTRCLLAAGGLALLLAACAGGSDTKAPPGPAEGEGEGEGAAEGEGEGAAEGEGEGPAEGEGEGPAEGEGEGPQPECARAEDCADEDPCTTEECVAEACVRTPVQGCCQADDDCDDGLCNLPEATCVQAAAPGDLLIAEIMANPAARAAAAGQWVELTNPGPDPVSLYGGSLEAGEASWEFGRDAPPEIAAGATFLIGNDAQAAGETPMDLVIEGVVAGADGGRLAVLDGLGNVIDEVTIDATWPLAAGASLSLSGDHLDAADNDDPSSWCPGQEPWEDGGDLGSPGAPNPDCPPPPPTVDWCRLQHPTDVVAYEGQDLPVFGRVWVDGTTDRSAGIDLHADLVGEAGLGPDGADPVEAAGAWTWFAAAANPDWDGAAADQRDNDEYSAALRVPGAGEYDLAFRFSFDAGQTWTYCDTDAGAGSDGSEDGYDPDDAGALAALANPCDGEACDTPPAAACLDIFALAGHESPGTCDVVDGDAVCTYEKNETNCREADQICRNGACIDAEPRPAPGEVIFTEIMYDVAAPLEDQGAEWFELYNLTDHAVRLDDCEVADATGPRTLARLVMEPHGYLVFARSDDPAVNGGLQPGYLFDFGLNDGGDTLRLRCSGADVDEVTYDDGPVFPNAAAASIRLDPGAFDAVANDDGANWCLGETVYFGEPGVNAHRGTPGAANPPCRDVVADWCRLQHPVAHAGERGSDLTAYGRLWDEGLTDRTDGVDAVPGLVAQAGYGARDSQPGEEWTWTDATPNAAWSGAAGLEPNNDEYEATFPLPVAGQYDLAYRFSFDDGETWLYCDGNAGPGSDGSEDGYQAENAGKLESQPGPCDDVVCDVPPAAVCGDDGVTLIEYVAPGACEGQGVCAFGQEPTDCSLTGGHCDAGVCAGVLPQPAEGEVIVTEILYDPHDDLAEQKAEWLELTNVAAGGRTLHGCFVGDASAEIEVVAVNLQPGDQALFVGSNDPARNGNLAPDGVFGFSLGNAGDEVHLRCGDTTIDVVAYDDGPLFPNAQKASIQLDPDLLSAALNDVGGSWCLADQAYHEDPLVPGSVHLGTPGAPNTSCNFPDLTVDWCRLQFPLDEELTEGTPMTVFGRVWDEGLTDGSPLNDPDPALLGAAGYGPAGSDPRGDLWQWFAAAPNAAWDGAAAAPPEPDNDEYQAVFPVPGAGDWDFAFRFALDGGAWLVCDRNVGDGSDGSQDGYQTANAGHLTSEADPCAGLDCSVAPAPRCADDGVTLVVPLGPGSCEVDQGAGACVYEEDLVHCDDQGMDCIDGECSFQAEPPLVGEVIFTEIMYDTDAPLSESSAEWFEIVSLVDRPVDLGGCVVADNGNNQTQIAGLVLAPSGMALFARSGNPAANGGLTPDHTFGFGLNNGGDSLILTCGDDEIDRVDYDDVPPWLDAQRVSLSLDPNTFDAASNDDGARWCLGEQVYFGDGDTAHAGTPGTDNPPCPVVDFTVDWCRLQWPLDLVAQPGTEVPVYGRLYEEGLTDRTDMVDPAEGLLAEAGWGPAGNLPGDGGWTWVAAQANQQWSGVDAGEADNDEYYAGMVVPPVGGYDLAFRFSLDAGQTWLLCDRDAGAGSDGSEDGFQLANAGHVTSQGGPCDGVTCDDPPPPECADEATAVRFLAPGRCVVSGSMGLCAFDTEETDCSLDGGACGDGVCFGRAAQPEEGEVIVTEVMYDPHADLEEPAAEWVELTNLTDERRSLHGCALGDRDGLAEIVGVVIEPFGRALFAGSADPAANGSLDPDGTFGFSLTNSGDLVRLLCGEVVVDTVEYDDGGAFPDARQASISLDPAAFDAADNDLGSHWCLAQDQYYGEGEAGNVHLGTPGGENLPCPVVDTTIDWCRLQWPESAQQQEGTELEVFGRVYDEEITDASPGVDPADGLLAEAGYGPDGSDPAADGGAWSWFGAEPNPGWDGGAANEAHNDEYRAMFVLPAPGDYDYAYRFSLDFGQTWLYCDLDAGEGQDGSEDGYSPDDAGALVSTGGPCDDVSCDVAPGPSCADDGVTLLTPQAPGVCEVEEGAGVCRFGLAEKDCSLDGGRCEAGECVGAAPWPAVGDVAITEILYDPQPDLAEQVAEWFEVANLTDERLSLHGCVIGAKANEAAVAGVVLEPRGFALFAGSADPADNGGLEPDGTFGFSLANTGSDVRVACGETVLDVVAYDDGDVFPDARQVSLSLDPGAFDPDANDEAAHWCLGVDPYYGEAEADNVHLGTPGAENPPCPDTAVDWCRLQFPEDGEAWIAEPVIWYGRVWDAGLTDRTTGVDPDEGLVAQVGYGPLGSEPGVGAEWSWVEAEPNPAWNGDEAGEPGNDEYEATFVAPEGLYDVAWRFSLGGGSWLYCDRNAGAGSDGSEDGYQVANAGTLAVEGGPCAGEACAQAPAPECGADGVTLISYLGPGTCTIEEGAGACAFGTEETYCADDGGVCERGACVAAPLPPQPGDVVVNEVMYDPHEGLAEQVAEWVELLNVTQNRVTLDGCLLGDEDSTVDIASVVLEPGGFALFAGSDDPARNGGLVADGTFDFSLTNGGDVVHVTCDGVLIDAIAYDDGETFPDARQASISLDPMQADAESNDAGAHWCLGAGVYWDDPDYDGNTAHLGTPGAENPGCPVIAVDWCRYQWPHGETVEVAAGFFAYGRVYEAGLTDSSDGVDADDDLVGQAGYGPVGTDPAGNALWTWVEAGATPGWSGAANDEPDNDEYQAALSIPVAADVDLAYRFSLDAGRTWTYCDRDAGAGSDGSEDGYQAENAGRMTVAGGPCAGDPCADVPAPACADDGVTLETYLPPGACAADDAVAVCTYETTTTDCSGEGGTCEDGACVGGLSWPAPGGVIFTEVLYDTEAPLADPTGEWFELTNVSGGAVTLEGCVVGDATASVTQVTGVNLEADGIALFVRSADEGVNGGLAADHTFGVGLNNGVETVHLNCGDDLIDAVVYDDGGAFPDARRASISLDPGAYDAGSNDVGSNWCLGEAVYFGADATAHTGTPGELNPPCPDTAVDWCRLQWPTDTVGESAGTLTVYGRVFDEGLTDLTPGVDADDALVAEAGLGARDSDPADGGWTWTEAVANQGWNGADEGEPDNDEYQSEMALLGPGDWDFAYRFSLDGGATWLYCDRNAGEGSDGSQDGYQTANAGKLAVP